MGLNFLRVTKHVRLSHKTSPALLLQSTKSSVSVKVVTGIICSELSSLREINFFSEPGQTQTLEKPSLLTSRAPLLRLLVLLLLPPARISAPDGTLRPSPTYAPQSIPGGDYPV